jgi:hypothetical protein
MFVNEIIPPPANENELEKEIEYSEGKMREMKFIKEKNAESILMGMIMNKLRGRVSAKKAAQKVSLLQGDFKNVKQ